MCLVSEVRSQTNTNRNTHSEDLRNINIKAGGEGRGWTMDMAMMKIKRFSQLYFKPCKRNGGLTEMSGGGDKIMDNVSQSLYGQI